MITIHSLTIEDFNDWEPLWQAYLVFYKSSVPDDVTKASFARMVDQSGRCGGFLARDAKGKAIGMVNWLDHVTNWSLGDSCYLQDLYVSEGGRGLGTGRALIEAVRESAQKRGCNRVYWQTHESNETAQVLYDRLTPKSGFIVYNWGL